MEWKILRIPTEKDFLFIQSKLLWLIHMGWTTHFTLCFLLTVSAIWSRGGKRERNHHSEESKQVIKWRFRMGDQTKLLLGSSSSSSCHNHCELWLFFFPSFYSFFYVCFCLLPVTSDYYQRYECCPTRNHEQHLGTKKVQHLCHRSLLSYKHFWTICFVNSPANILVFIVDRFQNTVTAEAATIFLWEQAPHASSTHLFKHSTASTTENLSILSKNTKANKVSEAWLCIPRLFIWDE